MQRITNLCSIVVISLLICVGCQSTPDPNLPVDWDISSAYLADNVKSTPETESLEVPPSSGMGHAYLIPALVGMANPEPGTTEPEPEPVPMQDYENPTTSSLGQGASEISLSLLAQNDTQTTEGAEDQESDTINMGINYSYYLFHGISLGLGVFGSQTDYGDDMTMSTYNLSANMRFHLDLGSVAPYIGPDIGMFQYDMESDTYEDSGSASSYGGVIGLKAFLSDQTAFFAEYFALFTSYETEDTEVEVDREQMGVRLGFSVFF